MRHANLLRARKSKNGNKKAKKRESSPFKRYMMRSEGSVLIIKLIGYLSVTPVFQQRFWVFQSYHLCQMKN